MNAGLLSLIMEERTLGARSASEVGESGESAGEGAAD